MLGSLIQFQFSYARNWPFGAAVAMFLLSLVILVLFFNAHINKRHREYENSWLKNQNLDMFWDFSWILVGGTAIFFGFLYIPIFVLVCYSFNSSKFAMIWTGFSFRWYAKLFSNDDIQNAALNSLIVAFAAAPMATIIATFSALVLVRGGDFRAKELSNGLITLPLMVPEIVTAVATLIFFCISWN